MNSYLSEDNISCFFKDKVKEVTCGGHDHDLNDLLSRSYSDDFEYKSELEYILLRSGFYDLPPINLKQYNICDVHYNHLIKKPRRDNCNTCKLIYDQKIRSTSDLRPIPRLISYGIWQDHQLSLFDQATCGNCRQKLQKKYVTDDLYEKSQDLFAWLYDGYTLYTPSTVKSSLHSIYEQSEEELMKLEKKLDLKEFLLSNDYDERVEMTNNYNQMNHKSGLTFLRQAKSILLFIVKILAPNDFHQVWNDLIESDIQQAKQQYNLDGQFGIVMNCVVDAYNNANHWSVRRQVLSIVAKDVPSFIITQFIPNITKWKIDSAKEQAHNNGRGSVVNVDRALTIRYTDEQIAHFIQYVLSPHITTDLPFGEKKINLSTGDTIIVPNTIRNLIPSRIIHAYQQYCKESTDDFQPLNDTCLYEILHGCCASTRKSLQGIDYFSADGSNAFDILHNLCDELATFGVAVAKIVDIKKALHQSRNYLKNDFKLHVQTNSEIADHCASFALSDRSESNWRESCDHFHHLECDQCLILKNTLKELRLSLESCTMKDVLRSRYLYRFDQNVQLIWDWKAHLMRSVQQDLAKRDILENLQDDSVMLLLDWAMKWLPMKYREPQRDFFEPNLKYAYIRTDNAGCYHCAETLLSIKQIFEETGIFIRRFDFVEPQNGKCCCDRMGAVCKCNVCRHMNEKNNVETSQEFVDAAKATKYVSLYASKIVSDTSTKKATASSKKSEWPGVNTFNNVEYKLKQIVSKNKYTKFHSFSDVNDEIEVTTWRSYNIGNGKKFMWSHLNTANHFDKLIVTYEPNVSTDNWMQENAKVSSNNSESDSDSEENEEKYDKEHVITNSSSTLPFFDCPDANCIRQFRRYHNLENHLATGSHKYPPAKFTLLDKAKLLYQKNMEKVQINNVPSIQDFQVVHSFDTSNDSQLKQGWALFNRKPQTPFSQEQIAFLSAKYLEGEQNGLKWEPSIVSELMMTAIENEEYIFEPSQCLSPSQIKSYFSRLTKKRRQENQPIVSQQNDEQESDVTDDDTETLHHAQLTQTSIEILKKKSVQKKNTQRSSTSSPSTIRKLDSRSNDDLTKHPPSKRISKKST